MMRLLLTIVALLATSSTTILAQTTSVSTEPPSCVMTCYSATIAGDYSGCEGADFPCLCQSLPFQLAINSCLQSFCLTVADVQAGLDYGESACAAIGIAVSTAISTSPTAATPLSASSPPSVVATPLTRIISVASSPVYSSSSSTPASAASTDLSLTAGASSGSRDIQRGVLGALVLLSTSFLL